MTSQSVTENFQPDKIQVRKERALRVPKITVRPISFRNEMGRREIKPLVGVKHAVQHEAKCQGDETSDGGDQKEKRSTGFEQGRIYPG